MVKKMTSKKNNLKDTKNVEEVKEVEEVEEVEEDIEEDEEDDIDDDVEEEYEAGEEGDEEGDEEENNEDDELKEDVELEDVGIVTSKKKNDNCFYKYIESDDDDEYDSDDDDDVGNNRNETLVKNEDRSSKPILSKYEYVRMLGIRAQQIANGAKPMIKFNKTFNSTEKADQEQELKGRSKLIAKMEIEKRVSPLIIKRKMPDGKYELWKLNELTYDFIA
jgi:DNA-directed RNA polymerase subunit K/omega